MHVFHILYRNTQGSLMRILNAASRRGIDMPYVQSVPAEHGNTLTLLLDVNPKQIGQLCRDWHAVVDVIDVRAGAPARDAIAHSKSWSAAPHLPAASVRVVADTASA